MLQRKYARYTKMIFQQEALFSRFAKRKRFWYVEGKVAYFLQKRIVQIT